MRRAALLASVIAAPALAAEPQPLLEGRWLGQAAQDVPGGLWWAGPTQRDAAGPDTLAEALASVPGLIITPAPGNGSAALIVRHGRSQPGSPPGSLLATPPPLFSLFDTDLLLVAPPGGLSDAAGDIMVSLRRPGDRLAGLGEFAAGAFGSRRALARIDLPLAKAARLGLGGHVQHDLGWLFNTTTGERLNRGLRSGVAGTLDLDLAPTLTLALTSHYARSKAGNLPALACNPAAPAQYDGRFARAGHPLGQRSARHSHEVRLVQQGPRLRLELVGALARQTGDLDLDFANDGLLAALALPAGLASGNYGLNARSDDGHDGLDLLASADLGALVLRAGAGISRSHSQRFAVDTLAGLVLADRDIRQDRDSRHGLVQARLEPGHGLALEAGLRVDRQTLSLAVTDRRPGCAPCLAPAANRQVHTLVTPEFALSWRASPEWLIFARTARSARLPGWNLLARSSAELQLLPAETGWHSQAGVKADLWNGRLRLDASGFVATTRALVSPLFGIDPLAMATARRQDMRNHGLDLVLAARPLPPLELAATLGWQRARWSDGTPGRLLYAPDTTASLSASWAQPLAGTGAVLVPRLAARWRSAMAVGPAIGLANGIAPGGWQVAAALQMTIPGGGWLVSLECENCLDQTLTEGAVVGLPTLNPPRWWQMRFTRRF